MTRGGPTGAHGYALSESAVSPGRCRCRCRDLWSIAGYLEVLSTSSRRRWSVGGRRAPRERRLRLNPDTPAARASPAIGLPVMVKARGAAGIGCRGHELQVARAALSAPSGARQASAATVGFPSSAMERPRHSWGSHHDARVGRRRWARGVQRAASTPKANRREPVRPAFFGGVGASRRQEFFDHPAGDARGRLSGSRTGRVS